ncbi:hypothetical protein LCI18_013473 [Fusarium solani-melongenae]|uniref:Uncharacterized protein n=1 Tax=Fusarium solani subsp. cucurbitae TaxID=2747967 RepID=A0ACD3ZN79_FUSSC|nr:hypothetical protein LCI18_013473 [Fusarium solani-melongenae]
MASTRTASRYTTHSAKARRSRIFNKDRLNMRDEIIVAGDESDAKRQPSREPQSSPSVVCLDGTTVPPTEPTEASDQHPIPPDGEDTLSIGWEMLHREEAASALMPLPGWDQRGPFSRLFCSRIAGYGSARDDASSIDSRQDDNKPILPQQAHTSSSRSKPSRASTISRRGTKQASVSKSSHKRNRKGASRDDHDQEGDFLMSEADVHKKQEDNGPWVCPFFRKDPIRHMDCITLTLNRIQDVKQHLTRRHTAELYCSTCFQEFQLHQEWEQHTQRRDCTRRPCPPHRVTPQAQDRLKVRVDRTMTAAEQWYEIWKILFEDEKPPHSPQQGSVIGEVISIIRDCWHEERGQILSELVRSEGISEKEAGVLGMFLPGLLDRVQDRVDPPQRESGVSEVPSNTDNSTRYVADQTGQTFEMGSSAFLAPRSDYSATPKLSKSPSPTTPILPDISGSNFQSLKLEPFTYDPSAQEDSFDQMMEQPYATSADNDELAAAMTFSGHLEGNCLETRGLLGYMDPVIDYNGLGTSAFASTNPVWPPQYPGHLEMFDGNDVTDSAPMVNQPLNQRCQGDPNIR